MTRLLHWLALVFTLLLFVPALDLRDPVFARLRPAPLIFSLVYCLVQAIWVLWVLRQSRTTVSGALWIATVLLGALTWAGEGRFRASRERVRGTPSAEVAPLGRHLMAGYRDPQEIRELIRLGAVGGVFVTAHNAAGKSARELAAEISDFQELQARYGRPRLWIATDQEGGQVSRLSPPLPKRPALSGLIEAQVAMLDERGGPVLQRVREFAAEQAQDLAGVGVNVNFAPVVDLRFSPAEKGQSGIQWLDLFSRIESRAIHRDPRIVAKVALEYGSALAASGVTPTFKHFPGLGRVPADTHWFSASVPAELSVLAESDWLVYENTLDHMDPPPWIMLAHVRLSQVDERWPASTSRAIAQQLLRGRLKFAGILVTDDLNMRPTYWGPGGIGQAAVRSLNAGVDMLLVSYDGENVYPVLAALLGARVDGRLDARALAASARRLEGFQP